MVKIVKALTSKDFWMSRVHTTCIIRTLNEWINASLSFPLRCCCRCERVSDTQSNLNLMVLSEKEIESNQHSKEFAWRVEHRLLTCVLLQHLASAQWYDIPRQWNPLLLLKLRLLCWPSISLVHSRVWQSPSSWMHKTLYLFRSFTSRTVSLFVNALERLVRGFHRVKAR